MTVCLGEVGMGGRKEYMDVVPTSGFSHRSDGDWCRDRDGHPILSMQIRAAFSLKPDLRIARLSV
jgi:hypothetical protein